MRTPLILLLLLAGCAAPPVIPRPVLYRPLLPVRLLAAPEASTYVRQPFTNTIPWQYPGPSNGYCWILQVSTNLADWQDVPGGCTTDPLFVKATNPAAFFRLKGIAP